MITKDQAVTLKIGTILHHDTAKQGKNNSEPLRCRVNGKCKTWKTRPAEFRLPVKRGLYEYGYIDETDADGWSVAE